MKILILVLYIIIAFSLDSSSAFSFENNSNKNIDNPFEIIPTPIIRIIALPDSFHKHNILVAGFLTFEFENNNLYLSKEDAKYMTENSLRVNFYNRKSSSDIATINGKSVPVFVKVENKQIEFDPLDKKKFEQLKSFETKIQYFNRRYVYLKGEYNSKTNILEKITRIIEISQNTPKVEN